MELTTGNIVRYARRRGLLAPGERPRVEPLAGGVACGVFRLHARRGPVVIKQAHEKFRVKAEWLVDRRRNLVEAKFQDLASAALGADHVPAVLDVDAENFAFTMKSAPLDAQNWKTMLLAGQIEPALGRQAGELLAKLHAMPAPRFIAGQELFRQQRIEPYFEFIRGRYPEVQPVIDELNGRRDGVTHGDFTPKNFLVAAGKLVLLDYEVVHVGWPEFDVASLVNHLTLKFIHLGHAALVETARQFLGGREVNLPLLGALLLARVDGKSPAEYLREKEKTRIRDAGQKLLRGEFASYDDLISGVNWPASGS